MGKSKNKKVAATPNKNREDNKPKDSKTVEGAQTASTIGKALVSTVVGIILLFIVKGFNSDFFEGRVMKYWDDYKEQKFDLDIKTRLETRYGGSYSYSKIITEIVRKAGAQPQDVLLMPSSNYFKSKGLDYNVPEPTVFYYFTGMKTVWQNQKMDPLPKWFCYFDKGNVTPIKINNKTQLDSILNILKPFPAKL